MSRLKVGDHVIIKGTKPGDNEYDVGEVISFTFSAAKVRWKEADAVYTESIDDLQKITVLK